MLRFYSRMTSAFRRSLVAFAVLSLLAMASPLVVTADQPEPAVAAEHTEADAHSEGWMPTVAKVFNFALLIGGLVYFLRSPVVAHLAARDATIRRELIEARTLRTSAEVQLAAVRARLAELPGELAALEARGRDELAHERIRLQQATADEKEKLVERTRRDIDLQFRVARRDLLEHTADLAMRLARTRIEQQITPDDQIRLIDRYAGEVRS